MHLFNIATVLFVVTLLGVEFSVSAFINPAISQVGPEAQLKMLGHSGSVLGRVMPVWYSACTLMLGLQTWLHWHLTELRLLLAADMIWLFIFVLSIFFLVPLNNRIVAGVADWQRIHQIWDTRHRVRIAALILAAALLTDVLVY